MAASHPHVFADRLSDRELGAWRGLLRAHAALVRTLDAELEAAHGLSLAQYEVLLSLAEAEEGRMRMHDLADRVLLSRSGVTRLVDRLERGGLLRRVACPSDARGQFACLTDAGRQKLAAARDTHLDGVRKHFLSHLGDEELDGLAAVWERVSPGAASRPESAL